MEFNNRNDITNALRTGYNKKDASFTNDSLALWQFANEMNIGDIIYVKVGTKKILGRGIVSGDYTYDDDLSTFRHIRKVKWTHIGEWSFPSRKFTIKTLTDISQYPDLIKDLNNLIEEKESETVSANKSRQYWWLVAAPNIWKFSDINVGDTMEYTLINDNGNKRRIYQNFIDAKAGDLVIGYASTPILQVVALGEISQDTDKKYLYFKKTEQLLNPVDYSEIKKTEELKHMECMVGGGRGSLFKITEEEYQILMEMIRKDNPLSDKNPLVPYTDEDFLQEVYMSASDLQKLKTLIKTKQNIILQGAPGVGKTFSAERLAYTLMGVRDKQRVEIIQFHQSYSYEDFIMGYKPDAEGGFELNRAYSIDSARKH